MARQVGDKIVNDLSGDASVFAGYNKDGQECWCDIGISDDTGQPFLGAPETKTFEGFNGYFTKWSQDLETFAESVGYCQ